MKTLNCTITIPLLLFINYIHGTLGGMLACAMGSHENVSSKYFEFTNENMWRRNVKLFAVEDNDIKFLLYKTEHPYPYQIMIDDESRLVSGNFDVTKQTKIIIHGFRNSYKSNACVITRTSLLKRGDFNIIVVDWERAQNWGVNHVIPKTYQTVVKELKDVAGYVTKMIQFLEKYGMDLNTTTIIGHSLGAHIAGLASINLTRKVNRIVGLDPAGPYFENTSPEERLSKDDAFLVEIIHTNIENCGLMDQIGHYDFYPNGGRIQPGCATHKCSHSRSYRLYAESVETSGAFYARRCSDWKTLTDAHCNGDLVIMGGLERTPIPEGIYYLQTNSESPYGMGP